jgi:uncharacterized membrane protein YcaP (DUF421 family)
MTDMTFYDIVGKKNFSDLTIHCDCLSVVMIGKITAKSSLDKQYFSCSFKSNTNHADFLST